MKKPGDGFPVTSYYLAWVRQEAGKGPEWLVSYHTPAATNSVTASRADSQPPGQLQFLPADEQPIPWRVTSTGEFKPHLTQSYSVDQNSPSWESSPGALTPRHPLSPFFYQNAKKGRERPQEYSFLNSCYYDWAHWGWRSGSKAMRTNTKVFPHIDSPQGGQGEREALLAPSGGAGSPRAHGAVQRSRKM